MPTVGLLAISRARISPVVVNLPSPDQVEPAIWDREWLSKSSKVELLKKEKHWKYWKSQKKTEIKFYKKKITTCDHQQIANGQAVNPHKAAAVAGANSVVPLPVPVLPPKSPGLKAVMFSSTQKLILPL